MRSRTRAAVGALLVAASLAAACTTDDEAATRPEVEQPPPPTPGAVDRLTTPTPLTDAAVPGSGPSPAAEQELRPSVVPDGRTFFLTRGTLPSVSSGTSTLPTGRVLSAEITCRGVGQFRLDVGTDRAVALVPPSAVVCSPDEGGVQETRALGPVPAGTELRFAAEGDPGVQYVVRIQSNELP